MTELDDFAAAAVVFGAKAARAKQTSPLEISRIRDRVPLYDHAGHVIAHYVAFAPGGYAIVNNNPENPVVIQFSPLEHPNVEGMMYGFGALGAAGPHRDKQLRFCDKLASPDSAVASRHRSVRTLIKAAGGSSTNGQVTIQSGWGDIILPPSKLPSGSYTEGYLPKTYSVSTWGTTGEFAGLSGAKNHCGATAGFNIVQYYRIRYGQSDLMKSTRADTFKAIFAKTGDGPITFLQLCPGLDRYIQDRPGNSSLSYSSNGGWSNIKASIDKSKMTTILLAAGIFDWHYVLGVGWRKYANSNYIRVQDGWENSVDTFIHSDNLVGSYITHVLP
jgi:hypothetical protein